ncbi:MAG TPA: hypothetical protein VK477_04145, partial [Acidobacteriota bacterium]|nr:hypothetical protein [Acidobacteriota bacterium]
MRNSRSNIPLLLTAVSVAGLLGVAWMSQPAGKVGHRTPIAANGQAALPADRIVHFETADAPDTAPTPALAENAPRAIEQLSPSEAAQFATLCDLRLMAGETELDLTTKQWDALAVVFMQTQAVRHHYEAQIATVREIAAGRYRIEIPPYAAAGDELRRQFAADLETAVGPAAAAEIMDKLGRKLDDRFAGFGIGTQTLEITGDPMRSPTDVQVASTAK